MKDHQDNAASGRTFLELRKTLNDAKGLNVSFAFGGLLQTGATCISRRVGSAHQNDTMVGKAHPKGCYPRQALCECMRYKRLPLLILSMALCASLAAQEPKDYQFDSKISRQILDNYLSRSITFAELLNSQRCEQELGGNVTDNIRFLKNVGAKFIGRAIYMWGNETRLDALVARGQPIAARIHQADPDIILQAAAFEIVSENVNNIPMPAWVFTEFGVTPGERNFSYQAMLYPDGRRVNHWSRGASVPDMSQLETRMWFLYLSARYIDAGVEAIHFGQVEIMDDRDPEHRHWRDMLQRVRKYAAQHARRHLILCDAHVPSGGIVHDGQLMFDFHSFPLRIDEVVDKPQQGILKLGYLDSLFGRSRGGRTPGGWQCQHLPFIVELDNFGASGKGGRNIGAHWIWGYDEICWFAHQPEAYRNQWLDYAWTWIRTHDKNGWLQMPGSRTLAAAAGKRWYWANKASPAVPGGFNQEETIKSIWARHERTGDRQ